MATVAVSFVLFTLFPGYFPHPEDFSPYGYAAAMLSLLIVWLIIPRGRRKWSYLPILLLCLLALLDETGYGSEVLDIQPYYSETYHLEIKDLHNAIGLGIELLQDWLAAEKWNAPFFYQLLLIDAATIGAAILFGWFFRWRLDKAEASSRQRRVVWLVGIFSMLIGLITVWHLLSIPPDPKNALLLGYSMTRLLSMLVILLLSATPLAIILVTKSRMEQFVKKANAFRSTTLANAPYALAWLVLIIGLAYQLYVPFVFLPDNEVRLGRATPLVLWAFGISVVFLLGWFAWSGYFRRSVTQVLRDQLTFLRNEPAYYYAGWAVFLILVAQLIDRNVIPLNIWIQTPNFHVQLWGLWTEETFEMIAGFLFLAAAYLFTKQAPFIGETK